MTATTIPPKTICINPWFEDDNGDQTYADVDAGDRVDGWSVYVRREEAGAWGDFEIEYDEDFPTFEAAMQQADDLVALLGLTSADINIY